MIRRFEKIQYFISNPSKSIASETERSRASLLSGLLFIFCLTIFSMFLSITFFAEEIRDQNNLTLLNVSAILYVCLYALSRTKFSALAGAVWLVIMCSAVTIACLQSSTTEAIILSLVFFLVVIIISSMIFKTSTTILYTIYALCFVMTLPHLTPIFAQQSANILVIVLAATAGLSIANTFNKSKYIERLTKNAQIIKNQHDEIIQSSKMAAVGELAGEIAHEVNNPLAIINGYAKKIKTDVRKDIYKNLEQDLDKINNTVHRISRITKSMLSLSRKSDTEKFEMVKLKTAINHPYNLCQERFKQDSITFKRSGDEKIYLNCQPTQISQTILNIFRNAIDALESAQSEKYIHIRTSEFPDRINIEITNSGVTIPEDQINKIMLPLYTTKGAGKGSGFGLSISKKIIDAHSGTLSVKSTPAETTFTISLPKNPQNRSMN